MKKTPQEHSVTINHDESATLLSRREFLGYSIKMVATAGAATFSPWVLARDAKAQSLPTYPIATPVKTTLDAMISFPKTLPGLSMPELDDVERYEEFGYGQWTWGSPLPLVARKDLLPATAANHSPKNKTRLARFFTISDIHITDKEAPNQLIHFQKAERFAYNNTSVYSPVMAYTTQVLDAAIQTVNALHKKEPFDFGLSLGDAANSMAYNETRWYIDVIDGQPIRPSSGAHIGEDTIDFQKPFQAVGLDKSIPWYQTLGNHDHFYLGSFPIDAHPALGIRESYTADTVWDIADILVPNPKTFPVLFDIKNLKNTPRYYPGLLDGSSPYGKVIYNGLTTDAAFANGAPKVAPDRNRRPLARTEWMQEFFKTTTQPAGHGFGLVDKSKSEGFACYSFFPRPGIPLKVIVLDNTQREDDGSDDIHGHGYLDAERLAWLKSELDAGQANDHLMIIAAHVPIAVSQIGSEMEWWNQTENIAPEHQNAIGLPALVDMLQNATNLLMWLAGHRHFNVVKAFPSSDASRPEMGFWQVETSSLRDFPQQFRTFDIVLNDDDTVSVVTLNVDPSVAEDTPAAKSRKYAIAAQQIVHNTLNENHPNFLTAGGQGKVPVPTMDPTRPQSDDPAALDPSIQHVDLSQAERPVPLNASYNAELFKKLSPKMARALRAKHG